MTRVDPDDLAATRHPDPTLPARERIGYLIYSWDATIPGDRTRAQYLELADLILSETERN